MSTRSHWLRHALGEDCVANPPRRYLSTVLATQLLLVDEVMKAGKRMGGGGPPGEEGGED